MFFAASPLQRSLTFRVLPYRVSRDTVCTPEVSHRLLWQRPTTRAWSRRATPTWIPLPLASPPTVQYALSIVMMSSPPSAAKGLSEQVKLMGVREMRFRRQ